MTISPPIFTYTQWTCTYLPSAPVVSRERVLVIVQHRDHRRYLFIRYTSNNAISFPSWWIDHGEPSDAAATREVREETSIHTLTNLTRRADWDFDVRFYSPHKKTNFNSLTHVYTAMTECDIDTSALTPDELAIQHPHRYTLDEMQEIITQWKETTSYESMEYLLTCIKTDTHPQSD